MKEFLKQLFKPIFTAVDLLIIGLVSLVATPLYNYSIVLYLLLFIVSLVSLGLLSKTSDKYYEVVENEFEKEDSK